MRLHSGDEITENIQAPAAKKIKKPPNQYGMCRSLAMVVKHRRVTVIWLHDEVQPKRERERERERAPNKFSCCRGGLCTEIEDGAIARRGPHSFNQSSGPILLTAL